MSKMHMTEPQPKCACEIEALFTGNVTTHQLEAAASKLGRLGSLWLSDAAKERLSKLASHGALLFAERLRPGEFAALFVLTGSSPNIADAFALPLRWRRDIGSDDRLPDGLRAVATRAREAFKNSNYKVDGARLELWLGDECPDLSAVKLECGSAEAIIRATFVCAAQDFSLALLVTASAAVEEGGLVEVKDLTAKARAARAIGIEQIAVVASQKKTPECVNDSIFVEIKTLTLEQQIAQLVGMLDAVSTEATLEIRRSWYHRAQNRSDPKRLDFFVHHYVKEIAEGARARRAPPTIDVLVMIAGRQAEPILLAAEVLRAPRVILLEKEEGEESCANQCKNLIGFLTRKPTFQVLRIKDRIDHASDFESILLPLLSTDERVGIDITPSPKDAALFLFEWARRHESKHPIVRTYIRSDFPPKRPDLGTEEVVVFD